MSQDQAQARTSADPLDAPMDINAYNDVDAHGGSTSPAPAPAPPAKTKAAAKPASAGAKRQRGASILPVARVQRIIKADRDVDVCSREATFLISMATEMFVKKITDEAYTNARLDKRKVVSYKDISKAVQQNEYLDFLKEAVPTPLTLSAALTQRQAKMTQLAEMEAAILAGTLDEEDDDRHNNNHNHNHNHNHNNNNNNNNKKDASDADETDGVAGGARDDDDQVMNDNGAVPVEVQRPAKKVKAKPKPASKAVPTSGAGTEEEGGGGKGKTPVKRTARQSAAALAAEAKAAFPAKATTAAAQGPDEARGSDVADDDEGRDEDMAEAASRPDDVQTPE